MASTIEKLNVLTKWRGLFAGWQLGTRAKGDPECDAVRDHREVTILLRAECSALVRVLVEKGVMTAEEWEQIIGEEADELSAAYARRFPGVEATEHGLVFGPEAIKTMEGWKP